MTFQHHSTILKIVVQCFLCSCTWNTLSASHNSRIITRTRLKLHKNYNKNVIRPSVIALKKWILTARLHEKKKKKSNYCIIKHKITTLKMIINPLSKRYWQQSERVKKENDGSGETVCLSCWQETTILLCWAITIFVVFSILATI